MHEGWGPRIFEVREFLGLIWPIQGEDEKEKSSKFKEKINELSQAPGIPPEKMSLYNDLWNLASPDMEITKDLINRLMEICYMYNHEECTSEEWFAPLFRYLGRAKFRHDRILSSAALLRKESEENREALVELNRVIGGPGIVDKVRLANLIKWDLRKFDIGEALERHPYYTYGKELTIAEFLVFMLEKCQKLLKGRELHMNVITLAETFGARRDGLPIDVRILKEYNRLCSSSSQSDMRIVLDERGKHYEFSI